MLVCVINPCGHILSSHYPKEHMRYSQLSSTLEALDSITH